jgi:peroxiredoxin
MLAGCRRPSEPEPEPATAQTLDTGSPAPDIEGKDLSGQALRLSDYRGKVVLLDFWRST